jgi:hypothetical protein
MVVIYSGRFNLLGSPNRYNLSITEQVALLNSEESSQDSRLLLDEVTIYFLTEFKILRDQFLVRHPTVGPKREPTNTHCLKRGIFFKSKKFYIFQNRSAHFCYVKSLESSLKKRSLRNH